MNYWKKWFQKHSNSRDIYAKNKRLIDMSEIPSELKIKIKNKIRWALQIV